MNLTLSAIDRDRYERDLADFLPPLVIDAHTHVWLKRFLRDEPALARGPQWPMRVADENPIEDLLETYRLMLPRQRVRPLLFGWVDRNVDLVDSNAYSSQAAVAHRLPCLLVTRPDWSAAELERMVTAGGFAGLKPYLNWAAPHIPSHEITIYDFLPPHQLEVASAHRWMITLHIPRPGRLRDPLNLRQLQEIEREYPGVRLVVAHIGRAYCPEDIGEAFAVLGRTERLSFDISANTSAEAMEQLLRAVGPRRVLFGSDMPVVRMRMRRICEKGNYVNLVPRGLYGDVCDDPHMREVEGEEAGQLSFFLYEQLLALRRASEAVGLGAPDLRDIFHENAARLLGWDPCL